MEGADPETPDFDKIHHPSLNNHSMIKHSLLLIYRNFLRFKSSFFINLIGLSTGLACALLIYLWVNDELEVDKFHEKDSRLFQVMENVPHAEGITTSADTPSLLAEILAKEMPEIAYAAVSTPPSWFPKVNLSVGGNIIKAAGLFVGEDYFNVFSYSLIQGDRNQVLSDKNSVVISEEVAMKLFNTTENILGKTIDWHLGQFKKQSLISGIFTGTPPNSSIQFDFVLPFKAFHDLVPGTGEWDTRGPFFTYVVLKEGANIDPFNAKLTGFIQSKTNDSLRNLFIKPYSESYLYGEYENGAKAGGRIEYVKLFSLIALFILLMACINFMNLCTAKASGRRKEVGIKKTFGASRKTLMLQYLGESMLMTLFSLILAITFIELFLPQFNEITGKQLTLTFNLQVTLVLLGITLGTGLIAGSYPALYLSGFNPVAVLKGKFNTSGGERLARKGLVVFQFTLSVIFIVSVLVVYKQMEFVQTKNLGYDKDHVIYFESEGKVPESMDTFLAEVKRIPGVVNTSSMVARVQGGPTASVGWKGETSNDVIQFRPFQVNYGLIETLGIEMKAGRAFSRNYGADHTKIIVNEAAIKAMGLEDPIGKTFNNKEIIGVVKNFHFQSLHEEVKPSFFILDD